MATRHYWINKTSKSPEMKSTREIFKTNPSLLDEPEVAELLDYYEQLQIRNRGIQIPEKEQ